MNDRDVFHDTFSGKLIDWKNWDVYVPDLACRCAKKAMENGWTFFGLQFYGEEHVLLLLVVVVVVVVVVFGC